VISNEAPRSKLRGITELNSEDFSEGEANPVASYGECQVQIGVQRSAVISALGEPDNYSAIEGGGYDDRYKLDPDAHHWAIKLLTGVF